MNCRHCGTPLTHVFADLATAPPSNAFLTAEDLRTMERYYPLRVFVCDACWLVQTEDYTGADELFSSEYVYFSAFSDTWLDHCRRYASDIIQRFGLDNQSLVVEIAANDGCLLERFKESGIPCYGVEPTRSTAEAARKRGIDIVEEFFSVELGERLAAEGRQADLTAANNVLAHVPAINDFVGGFGRLLNPHGVATFEFPHLLELVAHAQFDTIYHEHYSYLSLTTVNRILAASGLAVFDVETLMTHGGSLRVYAQPANTGTHPVSQNVTEVLRAEHDAGLTSLSYYQGFQTRIDGIKNDFLRFLLDARRDGRKVAAYGAAAKGNTLINYSGVRNDLLAYVVDRNPSKQGKYLPGSRIPVVDEAHLQADRPDYVVILPWNLTDEITGQLAYIREWGGRFVRSVPKLSVLGD